MQIGLLAEKEVNMTKKKKPLINSAHYLSAARFDIWIRLLFRNLKGISPGKIPQVIYITVMSLILFPFAILELLIMYIPVKLTKIKKPPVHIIGIWRSGTTNVQYTMSRDPQFGWLDPVSTVTFNNSILLGWLLKYAQKKILVDARPMDNMEYRLDLPMEDLYALSTYTTHSFNHMMVFPKNYREYLSTLYTDEMSDRLQREWERKYDFLLKKTTLIKRGRQLILKSPDNSCNVDKLEAKYPGSKFILISRNPYKIVPSVIKALTSMMEVMSLEGMADSELIENAAIEVFKKMNTKMFKDIENIPEGALVLIRHENFVKAPVENMEYIYEQLHLDGFEKAKPYFESYQNTQKEYKPNKLVLSPSLKEKINRELKFYFDYFGYEIEE